MEKLTYKTELGVSMDKNEDCPTCSICWDCDIPPRKCKYISDALKKLANYEDLEEQGRLIKLPCKVGDTVYVNGVLGCGEAERYRVIRVDYHSTLGTGRNEFYIEALLCADPDSSIAFYDKQFGKTVFLTREEAEAKLKELRGGEDE